MRESYCQPAVSSMVVKRVPASAVLLVMVLPSGSMKVCTDSLV